MLPPQLLMYSCMHAFIQKAFVEFLPWWPKTHGFPSQFRKKMYYEVGMTVFIYRWDYWGFLELFPFPAALQLLSEKEIQAQISVPIAHLLNYYAGPNCPALGFDLPQANIYLSVTMPFLPPTPPPIVRVISWWSGEAQNIKGLRNTDEYHPILMSQY